jgi:hypothetical protein
MDLFNILSQQTGFQSSILVTLTKDSLPAASISFSWDTKTYLLCPLGQP